MILRERLVGDGLAVEAERAARRRRGDREIECAAGDSDVDVAERWKYPREDARDVSGGLLAELDDADGALVRNEDVVEQGVVARRCPHTQGVPGLDGGDAFFSARDEGVHDLWVFGVGVVAGVHAEPIPRR
ncbi:Uncharacterised protein [Mycobacteroides abscessus subsp. abscessus]|nr:Uncharacterised protein [Mycobacteroides abscessus subsp. abscessus]